MFLFFNVVVSIAQNNQLKEIDSIMYFIEKMEDKSKSDIERLTYAQNVKRISQNINNDSLLNKSLKFIALQQYKLENYNLFKRASQEFLNHSKKIEDSLNIGRAQVYLGQYYYKLSKSESAYSHFYNAEKIFKSLNEDLELGKTLLRIAIIQKNEKDFAGSEVTTFDAINLLKNFDELDRISFCYNNLGIIYNELGEYDDAIAYHEKALDLRKKGKNKDAYPIAISNNNLAVVYKNAKQYERALEKFNLVLRNMLVKKNQPIFYAMVLDNYAHTKLLLNQKENLPSLFFEAKKVCDSLNEEYKTIEINFHLSEYYQSIKKLDSAKYYAYNAKNIAERYHNDDYLKSLLHLSRIENDSLSVKHYEEYIELNDSLVRNERDVRNKFARIRFETKEKELKNIQYSKERLYLLILSIGLLLTIFLTYNVISQRAKNKELKFTQQQQEANEEIYNLMLSQQDKIDEGRAQEKKRISEDLHDGILGRLFGTRLSLDSLNNNTNDDAIKNRSVYIDELKSIEQEIRKISHDLNSDFIAGSSYFDIIETLVKNQTQAFQLSFELNKNDDINWELVSNKTKINLYRIVQESLQNIYKHANAKHVKINFEQKNDYIILNITDDGLGFDVNKAKKGIGLKNIRSRATELNGDVKIESMREQGTTILVNVPTNT